MPRFVRNSLITAKVEASYGLDAAPAAGSDAILVRNLSINPLNSQNVDRALVRPYFGGSEQLVGSAYVECEFEVEFAGSGTANTVAFWNVLTRACGFFFGETLASPARVEYSLDTDYSALESVTIYYYDDGALHKLLGARGSFSLSMKVGEIPVLKFKFTGLDGGVTAVSTPSPTYTAWQKPRVVTDLNTGALVLGASYAAGAFTGGTEYVSTGLELDLGNDVQFVDLLGTASAVGQTVSINNRNVTGTLELDLTGALEVSRMADVRANNTLSLGISHGTTTGHKTMVWCPSVQLVNPKKIDKDGRRLIGFDLRVLPSAGNDELKLVSL